MSPEKDLENVEEFLESVQNTYKEDLMYFLGKSRVTPVEVIPTGSLSLDLAIGHYDRFLGIPLGRISLLWGGKGSGKTTLANHVIANAQKQGRQAVFLDYEFAYDPYYAQKIGVKTDELIFGQFSELERGWEIIEATARSIPGCLIVVDSISQMTPRAELEGEFGDSHYALQAKLLTQAMRKTVGVLKTNNAALLCVNQVRAKIGGFGNQKTMSGGYSFGHALSLRIDLYHSSRHKTNGEVVSQTIKGNIAWSKIERPYGKSEYIIRFGEGIDQELELINMGVEYDIIDQRGAYYYYDSDDNFAQGKENAKAVLMEDEDMAQEIRERIIKAAEGGEECGA